jgi:hypothetical protein
VNRTPAEDHIPPALDEARQAAANNAEWHDAVYSANGRSGQFVEGIWRSYDPAPRFFSNAVTTAPGPAPAQSATIDDLTALRTNGFAVKDSFANLDLTSMGFRVLFTATWIWRDAAPAADISGWQRISDAAGLVEWEAALQAGGPAAGDSAFPPAILANPALAFFALRRNGRIVSGAAANRSAECIGISNVFGAAEAADLAMAAAAALAASVAPGLPLAGYESGAELDRAIRLGFRAVGPLRVWVRGD